MPGNNHSVSDVSPKTLTKTDRPAPDLYTGEPPLQSAHNTWAKVRNDLAYALGANIHRSWTARLRVSSATDRIVTLSAPTRFIANKIEAQYADTVRRLWKKHDMVDPARDVMFSAAAGKAPTLAPQCSKQRIKSSKNASQSPALAFDTNAAERKKGGESPRDRFTFDNFVVGASNELAFRRGTSNCQLPRRTI